MFCVLIFCMISIPMPLETKTDPAQVSPGELSSTGELVPTPALKAPEKINDKEAFEKYLVHFYNGPKGTPVSLSKLAEVWDFSENGVFIYRDKFFDRLLRKTVELELAEGKGNIWLYRYLTAIADIEPNIYSFLPNLRFLLYTYLKHCGTEKNEAFLRNWLLLERYLACEVPGGYPIEKWDLEKNERLLSVEVGEELAFLRQMEPFRKNTRTLFKNLSNQVKEGASFCDLEILDPRDAQNQQ